MVRRLLVPLLASLSIAPSADIRLYDEPFALDDGTRVNVVCYEQRPRRTLLGVVFDDRVTYYLDGDRSGTIESSADRVVDGVLTQDPERWLIDYFYHDAKMDYGSQIVFGPVYRSGVAVVSPAEWEGHLEAKARFLEANETYEAIRSELSGGEEYLVPTCDLSGFFTGINLLE